MDYLAANDHPNNVLRAHSAALYHDSADAVGFDRALVENRADGYARAATFLMAHEFENDVTFVALDNETLTALVDAYKSDREDSDRQFEVFRLVRDLLGLDDA